MEEKNLAEIGQRIKYRRNIAGYTQLELGKLLGVNINNIVPGGKKKSPSCATVSNIENGKTVKSFDDDMLERFANILRCPVSWLRYGVWGIQYPHLRLDEKRYAIIQAALQLINTGTPIEEACNIIALNNDIDYDKFVANVRLWMYDEENKEYHGIKTKTQSIEFEIPCQDMSTDELSSCIKQCVEELRKRVDGVLF